MTEIETEQKVEKLSTDLYYDLLEKYVCLKANWEETKIVNKTLKVRLAEFMEQDKEKYPGARTAVDRTIGIAIGIVIKYGKDYPMSVNKLKQIQEVTVEDLIKCDYINKDKQDGRDM